MTALGIFNEPFGSAGGPLPQQSPDQTLGSAMHLEILRAVTPPAKQAKPKSNR